ncbi:MAG: lysozyme inhibitor LprI family protein [Parachlamydia sp.]|nr:lysozyme inhibitor LprI family protein [Parachlamydia sp.]
MPPAIPAPKNGSSTADVMRERYILMKRVFLLSCIIFFIFTFVVNGENRASFDCKKARTSIEKCICSDRELSYADSWLTGIYLERLKFLSEKEKKDLKTEQIAWLKNRDKACNQSKNIKACLIKMYEERTKELNSRIPGLVRFDLKPAQDLKRIILKSNEFDGLPENYFQLSDHEYLFPVDSQGGRMQLGIYYANTKINKMDKITSWYPSIEGVIKGKGITWLIVYYTDLEHGFSNNGYNAVMIMDRIISKEPYRILDLASISSPYIEEDYGEEGPCSYLSDSQKQEDNSYSELKGYDVKDLNGDGVNDMVFHIERFNCKTKIHSSITETYYFLPKEPYLKKIVQEKKD